MEEMKNKILTYLKEATLKPLTAEAIASGMQLSGQELEAFWPALAELEEQAAIIRNRSRLYGLPQRMNLVVGQLSMTAKGFGFIIPDERESEEDTDVFVPGGSLESAMNGDRVVARLVPSPQSGRSREGEIIRIVTRANTRVVGNFAASEGFAFVTPDDRKIGQDIFIPRSGFGGATTGMKVVVEITRWPEARRSAEGTVLEVLGTAGDPGVDVLSVMRRYHLDEEFPAEVQKAADRVPQQVLPEEYKGRLDRRDLAIVTIDGDDSKDFDDGVYAERRPDGGFFLGVYIADVSWYVREHQPLDKEAAERATSVYLVDRVIPMLPFALSNGICSLNQGVDRLSMACEMEIDKDGKVVSYEIVPAVIKVRRRLTYNIVNRILVDRDAKTTTEYAELVPMLEVLRDLRHTMKAKRERRGSIDFELAEIKVKLDAEGHPLELIKRTGSLSESIIEECMLAANETVAEHMDRKHLPFIYRVHEQPKEEKIDGLNDLLSAFGQHINKKPEKGVRPMDVQKVLTKVKGTPEERIISTVALRSMQQARYSPDSLGHFGLAARYYTHFTSPIRRYPDLIVHRLLRETFAHGTMSLKQQESWRSKLPEIALHSSAQERVAVEAERETTEMKEIEYMLQYVGESFKGIISGVTSFGIFVELENGVEGLVRVSRMVNDYYEYVESRYALVGERTHFVYRLGDEVEVTLVRASVEERTLDFILTDNGVYIPEEEEKRHKSSHKAKKPSPGEGKGGKGKGRGKKGAHSKAGSQSASHPPKKPKTKGVKNSDKSRKKGGGRRNKNK